MKVLFLLNDRLYLLHFNLWKHSILSCFTAAVYIIILRLLAKWRERWIYHIMPGCGIAVFRAVLGVRRPRRSSFLGHLLVICPWVLWTCFSSLPNSHFSLTRLTTSIFIWVTTLSSFSACPWLREGIWISLANENKSVNDRWACDPNWTN